MGAIAHNWPVSTPATTLGVPPAVSIIVVSADSGTSLRDCARRALACVLPLQFILIDNDSHDGVPQMIERDHPGDPRLQVIYNGANLGFGPAINRAATQAAGEALLVLNPDCLLEDDTLQRLLDHLEQTPRAGVIGAVVCDENGMADPASFRRDPLLARSLRTFLGRAGEGVNIAGPTPDRLVRAEAVSGALMLMPRDVFRRIDGFDEAYFLHCEDLDICRRVRDAGYEVWLAGDVHVLHGKGTSSRHRPVFVSWYKHRGMWRWFRKFDPAARNPLLVAIVWVGIWAHFLLKIPGQWWRLAKRRTRKAADPAA